MKDPADVAFTLVYEFNAPKKLVFNAFSDAKALSEWWGPVECKNSVIKLDFKKGGVFHYKMEKGGTVNFGRFIFGEIVPYDCLEFTNSFSDEKGNIVRAPFDIPFPLQVFYRLIFTESNGKTTITMTGQPVQATDEEIDSFRSLLPDMRKGFGASFGKLSDYLFRTMDIN
jgi:uncharacterized protein YndB with AHSA1/START domain